MGESYVEKRGSQLGQDERSLWQKIILGRRARFAETIGAHGASFEHKHVGQLCVFRLASGERRCVCLLSAERTLRLHILPDPCFS